MATTAGTVSVRKRGIAMTHEEAIKILEDMKVDIPVPKAAVTQTKRNIALDMAVDVLSNCSEIPNSWVPERKKGEWIKYCKLGVWECDQCGTQFKFPFKQHYFCPNCGADMRQREEDNV